MHVSIIGAGHVGTNLAFALHRKGVVVDSIWARQVSSANGLGLNEITEVCDDVTALCASSNVYVVCVPDGVLLDVLSLWKRKDAFLVHTSGSLPLDVLAPFADVYGVLYPMQTFNKSQLLDFEAIPIFFEANEKRGEETLKDLGQTLSPHLYAMDSEKRKSLHVAAVFACNFANHVFAIAEELCEQTGVDVRILDALIEQTVKKRSLSNSSKEVQTGPAVRGDWNIIESHLDYLKDYPHWQSIYRLLSESIVDLEKKRKP